MDGPVLVALTDSSYDYSDSWQLIVQWMLLLILLDSLHS